MRTRRLLLSAITAIFAIGCSPAPSGDVADLPQSPDGISETEFELSPPNEQWNAVLEDERQQIWARIPGATYSVTTRGPVSLHLLKHDWSGFARIQLNGVQVDEIDLYAAPRISDFEYLVDAPVGQESRVDVIVSDRKNSASQDTQVWILGVTFP